MSRTQVYLRVKPGAQSLRHSEEAVVVCDRKFVLDAVFGQQATQTDVFEAVARPAVISVLQGYNASVFAYGASGGGKTFTLMSEDGGGGGGILQRSLRAIFETSDAGNEVSVRVSCLEIYLETVADLLVPGNRNLALREDAEGRVYAQGLTEISVASATEAEAFLVQAVRSRATAATLTNAHSSRSHCVFVVDVTLGNCRRAKLNIVDLAGSERHGNLLAGNFRETGSINKSLFALTGVVQALVGNFRVPYRDSKLTYLLRDSLGGNSKTSFVLVVDPAHALHTTLETLNFGERMRLVKNHPVINETSETPDAEKALLLDKLREAEIRAADFQAQALEWERRAQTANKALEAVKDSENLKVSPSPPAVQPQPQPRYFAFNQPLSVSPFFPNQISLDTPNRRQVGSLNAPISVSPRTLSPSPAPFLYPAPQFLTARGFGYAHSAQTGPSAEEEVRALRQLLTNNPERAKREAAEQRAQKAERELEELKGEYQDLLERFNQLNSKSHACLPRTKSGLLLPGVAAELESDRWLGDNAFLAVDCRVSPGSRAIIRS